MKVLVFSSRDCRACKSMKQALTILGKRHGFEVAEYFVEDNLEVFQQFGVAGTPVSVVLDDDAEEIGRFIGHQTETSVENILKQYGCIE